jgi:hypothetical protein
MDAVDGVGELAGDDDCCSVPVGAVAGLAGADVGPERAAFVVVGDGVLVAVCGHCASMPEPVLALDGDGGWLSEHLAPRWPLPEQILSKAGHAVDDQLVQAGQVGTPGAAAWAVRGRWRRRPWRPFNGGCLAGCGGPRLGVEVRQFGRWPTGCVQTDTTPKVFVDHGDVTTETVGRGGR